MKDKVQVVILAGGLGTRISEESHLRPKPMIEIGGMPIIWHIMKTYSHYGYNNFVICCGYKGYMIKEYFSNYYLHQSDVTFDFSDENKLFIHNNIAEPWKVTVLDTGMSTMTGGRIKRIKSYIGDNTFMLTYGDGLCSVNIDELMEFHVSHGKQATITAIQPGGRFGSLDIDKTGLIHSFAEKRKEDGGWINGGYMVLEPQVLDLIVGDETIFEKEPLEILANTGELNAYLYCGFWQCMDTLRDKEYLEGLLNRGKAPWKVWR